MGQGIFGKYRSSSLPRLVFFVLLILTAPIFCQDYVINGYEHPAASDPVKFNRGMRLKGFGDYLYNKKSYAQAVPYYQQALELIPTEADASFNLARIYHGEKLYRLAELYYNQSLENFQKPENYGKTQLKAYMAKVHLAEIYHEQGLRDKTLAALAELRAEEGILKTMYTPAWDMLEGNLGKVYPSEAVLSRPAANTRTTGGRPDSLPAVREIP